MLMERVFTDGLAQVSFVIGSSEAKRAVVIDPRRDVQVYLDYAAAHGLQITDIFETHVHADYASGARELAAATGATMHLSRLGMSEFDHHPVDDGDVLEVGELRFEVLLTPGHTPEHISILLTDTSAPNDPPLLFSGDTLFVGSVGRPDLLGAEQTHELAEALYETVDKLKQLDDNVIVYPGHGAGSACGKAIGSDPSTTIGQERRVNFAFRPMDKATFVERILEGLPTPPLYFPVMKKLNKVGPTVLDGIPSPGELDIETIRRTQESDSATLLDVRPANLFGKGFLAGALNVGLGPNLPNWAGWSVSYERPIVLIVEDASEVEEAMTWLIRIGLDDVAGYVVGVVDAWTVADLKVDSISSQTVEDVHDAGDHYLVLDVREKDEHADGRVAGSVSLPMSELMSGKDLGETDKPIAVMCAGGYRSSLAASVLRQRGHESVINVEGGLGAWREAGLPVEGD